MGTARHNRMAIDIPPALHPPAGEVAAFVVHAEGVQVYMCKSTSVKEYQWTFIGPEATLSENGVVIGKHGAGPVWQSVRDGSMVKGTVVAKADGGAGNIPWLLLSGTPAGSGKFGAVTSIQRVATQGGLEPPAETCDENHASQEAKIPYAADYYFYSKP